MRRHAFFSCREPSANPWTFDLAIGLLATPGAQYNGFTPFVS